MDVLKEFETNLAYHFSELINMPLARPYWIYISLSHECNFNCQMCGVKKILKGKELDSGVLKAALDEIANWNSDCVVVFTGGEPFLRKDVFEIISHSVSLGIKTEIVSNGSQINNPDIAGKIIESGLKNVAVSLDGANPDTHDYIRGTAGAHKMALSALRYLSQEKKLRKSGSQISVWVTIMKENVTELDKILLLAKESGVECLVYHPVIVVQEDMQNTINSGNLWITNGQINILKEQINRLLDYRQKHGLVAFLHDPHLWVNYFQQNLTKKDWKCNPFAFIDIGPDGFVRSCGPAFGNIKEMGLTACLNTEDANAARSRMQRCQRPCLQTCWAWPEGDSLPSILERFIKDLDCIHDIKDDKVKAIKEGIVLLNKYETLIKARQAWKRD